MRWAQVMKSEPTLRFVSMQDGKTPLFMWLMIPLFKIFHDPLFAGRFLSVLAGFTTLIGVFVLTFKIFGKKAAIWAALIYTITPYTLFFDRMALVDSMLASFTIWAIYFGIWLLQSPRLDLAMILGYLLGGSILVKTPGMFNLFALPLTLIGFNFKAARKNSLLRLLLMWVVAVVIGLTIYNLLRLGPGFEQLSSRNADYVFSPLELKGRPLDPFIPHLHDIQDWFKSLITWPIIILIFSGVSSAFYQKNRLALAVLTWIMVPLIIEMAFLKTFTARYILLCIPPMLVFAGFGVEKLLEKAKLPLIYSAVLSLIVISPLALYNDYLLVTDPAKADLPKNERRGYLEDWTAGYGFPEIAEYLIAKNKEEPLVVGTDGFFGTLPDGLYIYMDKAGIPVVGSSATISATLRETAEKRPTYFVANRNRLEKGITDAKIIMEFPKAVPVGRYPQDAIILYQIFPQQP